MLADPFDVERRRPRDGHLDAAAPLRRRWQLGVVVDRVQRRRALRRQAALAEALQLSVADGDESCDAGGLPGMKMTELPNGRS